MKTISVQPVKMANATTVQLFNHWIKSALMAVAGMLLMWGTGFGQTTAISGERLINNVTAGDVENYWWSLRATAVQPDGGYIITWIDRSGLDGQGTGIYARMYDASGTPRGNQFLVNANTSGDQFSPSIAVAPDGEFVIAWEGPGSSLDVWGQIYTKDGVRKGPQFLLSTTISGNQRYPEVVYFPDGTFVAGFVDGASSRLQKFTNDGRTIGLETVVSTGAGDVTLDGLEVMPDGKLLMFWTQGSGATLDVYAQIFSNNLVAQGLPTLVNTYTTSFQRYSLGRADVNGNIVIVWESNAQDLSGVGVYGQRFDKDLNKIGSEFRVNQNVTANNQYGPSVAVHESGRFVICWSDDNNLDGGGVAGDQLTGTSIWFQEYDVNGNRVGSETRINESSTGEQQSPLISINTSGRFIIGWQGNGTQPGNIDNLGIFARAYQMQQTGTTSMAVSTTSGVAGDTVTVTMTLSNPTTIANVQPCLINISSSNGLTFASRVSGPVPATQSVGPTPVTFTWKYILTTRQSDGFISFGTSAHSAAGDILPFASSPNVSVQSALFLSDLTAPNLIGDENKPDTEGPNVFSIGAKVTNGSIEPLTDVVVNLGNGVSPGVFPVTSMTKAYTNNTYEGSFSLTPAAALSDYSRPVITLGPARHVIAGYVDIDKDGSITSADDGTLSNGKVVIDGRVDVDGNNSISSADSVNLPGKFYGWREAKIFNGLVDINGDGTITSADNGNYGGETRTLYWQVQYATVDAANQPTFGNKTDFNDDLRYSWIVWASAKENGKLRTDTILETAKVRAEITANPNKLVPSGGWISSGPPLVIDGLIDVDADGSITNADDGTYYGKPVINGFIDMDNSTSITPLDDGTINSFPVIDGKVDVNRNLSVTADDDGLLVQVGQTFSITVHNADFGTIGAGFDENRDGESDYDVWYQPIGENSWASNAFRLVDIQADVWGTGSTSINNVNLAHYDNEPYLSQLIGATQGGFKATYTYTFVVMASGSGSLTPYQEAASGSDNEKYNGDYGIAINVQTGTPSLSITKSSSADIMKTCDEITWTMGYLNSGTAEAGEPLTGNGVIIEDSVPASQIYVANSATATGYPYTVFYSTDNGASWSSIQPSPASLVNRIRWHIDQALPANGNGTVSFKTTMNGCLANGASITNIAGIKIGSGAYIASATKVITAQNLGPVVNQTAVTRNFTGCSTAVITGPAFSTTSAVSSEAEFENATNQGLVSDDCAVTEVTYSDVAVGTCPIVVTRTWVFKDACGNTTNSIQTLNINTTTTITGTLYNDANGLSDNQINGVLYTTGNINAVLIKDGLVVNSVAVSNVGTFTFNGICAGNYVIQMTMNAATVGNPPPAILLPAGFIATGELEGSGTGSDGNPNSTLSVTVVCGTPTTTLFGIKDCNASCVTYRTTKDGHWNDVTVWEVQACNGTWSAAAVIPPQGSQVNIQHVIKQNVDFTVQHCPLILADNGSSKLIIEPNITLGFAGGNDGNAYFNNRPVVVRSTINGTGAIGTMLTNSKTSGDENVTLERFIPGVKRRWNLLTPGVVNGTTINTSTTLRDAWAGGSKDRVTGSNNRDGSTVYPLGNPPGGKPSNVPFPLYAPSASLLVSNPINSGYDPAKYTPYDATLITGHRNTSGTQASAQGFDWWDELIIPAGEPFYITPTQISTATNTRTTPASIRPYRPNGSTDFGPERGSHWLSNNLINSDPAKGGRSIVQLTLNELDHGYMIFTRGDRRVLENWFDSTTLRPTGKIRTGDVQVTVNSGPAQSMTVVPNPYPAPISLEKLYTGAGNENVMLGKAHVWDSKLAGSIGLGGWVTLTRLGVNDWVAVPTVSADNPQLISSSQAFMVEGSATGGTLTFSENMKVAISDVEFTPFDNPSGGGETGILITNLNNRNTTNGTLSIIDGVGILLNDKFTSGITDVNDVRKVFNFENGKSLALVRDGNLMAIDAVGNPKTETVFPLQIGEFGQQAFSFTFTVRDLEKEGREAWLRDKFLGTETPISLTSPTQYNFEGNADANSMKPDRFEIVFKSGEVLPVTFTSVNAVQQGKNVNVTWNVATEEKMSHYEVEHSTNGTAFGKAVKVDAKNTSPANYEWLHVQPGNGTHFYRVRAFNLEGRSLLTKVVKVTLGDNQPGFKAFPTVVSATRQVTLQLISLDKGKYTLQVTDMAGRVISARTIEHNGGSASMILQMPPALSAGKYNIRLSGTSGSFVESVLKD